jgi:hypothetical protein
LVLVYATRVEPPLCVDDGWLSIMTGSHADLGDRYACQSNSQSSPKRLPLRSREHCPRRFRGERFELWMSPAPGFAQSVLGASR